jgi:hypothetical protein
MLKIGDWASLVTVKCRDQSASYLHLFWELLWTSYDSPRSLRAWWVSGSSARTICQSRCAFRFFGDLPGSLSLWVPRIPRIPSWWSMKIYNIYFINIRKIWSFFWGNFCEYGKTIHENPLEICVSFWDDYPWIAILRWTNRRDSRCELIRRFLSVPQRKTIMELSVLPRTFKDFWW